MMNIAHPYTLVRVVSFSLISAFMGYYAFIPFVILIVINFFIAMGSCYLTDGRGESDLLFVTAFSGLCAPFCFLPSSGVHKRYLKRSLLTTNLVILSCLLYIKNLPSNISPADLVQTIGYRHLRFESLIANATSNATATGAKSDDICRFSQSSYARHIIKITLFHNFDRGC